MYHHSSIIQGERRGTDVGTSKTILLSKLTQISYEKDYEKGQV